MPWANRRASFKCFLIANVGQAGSGRDSSRLSARGTASGACRDDKLTAPDPDGPDQGPRSGSAPPRERPSSRRPSKSTSPEGRSGVSARPELADQVVEPLARVRDVDLLGLRGAPGRRVVASGVRGQSWIASDQRHGEDQDSRPPGMQPHGRSTSRRRSHRLKPRQTQGQVPISPPEGMNTSATRNNTAEGQQQERPGQRAHGSSTSAGAIARRRRRLRSIRRSIPFSVSQVGCVDVNILPGRPGSIPDRVVHGSGADQPPTA